jgi:peptidoglycan/xylan/chitin deacetylase (PgdA/CDA1 family)
MFHDVKDDKWFVKTIELLKRYYTIISIEDVDIFYNQNKTYKSSCVLSFDDGDESFYHTIFPILKKLKIPAVLYVSPKRILNRKNFWFQEIRGYDEIKLKEIIADYLSIKHNLIRNLNIISVLKCLKIHQIEEIISIYKRKINIANINCVLVTSEQLIEMHKSSLVTIGAHTQNHPILANEDDQSSEYEISHSINELSVILNSEVKYFAYPNGIKYLDYTQREIDTLNKNGISITVSTNINHFNNSENRQEVPRMGISYGSNVHIIGKIILGKHWAKLKIRDNQYSHRLKMYAILNDHGKL